MASVDIIELRKTDTGERFYPLTHVNAVVGLSDRDFFEKYTDDNGQTYSVRLKQQYAGLWADGFIAAGGLNANSGGGGGGGVENLWALSDVYHSTSVLRAGGAQSVQPGDILSYGAGTNNQQWYARPVDTTPTLNSTGLITSGAVYSAVSAINALIPSAATSSNQLADKAFVNSSIASSTGSFDGTYNLVSDLNLSTSATHSQTATALASAISSPSNNDYCFVQVPTSDSTPTVISSTDRYKYNGSSWAYEYSINNSSFTQAQWDAINSGVTTTKVGNYDTHIADSTIHVTAADKAAWDAKVSNVQADWNATTGLAAILNRPSIPDPQIQSDWSQTNTSSKDYIKNKPTTWALSNITGADDLKLIEALTGSGLLKRNANNTWSLDSSTYLTANQTITLTGDVTGSGTTSIATTIGTGKVTNAMLAGSIENSKLNTIGVTKGGTGLTSINKGAILYASASNTIAALSANGTNTKKYLTQTSNNAPAWGTIQSADLPDLSGTYKTVDSLKSKGSATLPVYFDSNGAAQTITGLVVSGNIQTTGGTLSVSGATTLGSTLSVAGALTLTTTKKIWFGDTYYLELDSNGLHTNAGFYSDSFVSGGGLNSGSGGGGGVENLWALNDVKHSSGVLRSDGTPVVDGDVLVYGTIATNTKGWYAAPQATGGITGITMNGSAVTVTGGIASLGTVLTSDANYVKLTGSQNITGTKTIKALLVIDEGNDGLIQLDSWDGIYNLGDTETLSDALAACANVIETIKVNNTALTPSNKAVNITVPTVNSDFYAPTSAGSSGQYLVSSGSGAPTWKSAGSIANNDTGFVTGGAVYTELSSYQTKVSALGNVEKPVYISAAGTFSACYKYAGGSVVRLNGTLKDEKEARIYAPTPAAGQTNDTTASGLVGQVLVSSGLNNAPTWRSEIFVDKTNSRVGIGTTSPSYKLHVSGSTCMDDLYINGNNHLYLGTDMDAYLFRTSGDVVKLASEVGNIELQSYGYDVSLIGSYINLTPSSGNFVKIEGNVRPGTTNTYNLGSSGRVWNNLYTNYVKIGPATIYYDSTNKCLRVIGTDNGTTIGFCCDGQVAAGGIVSNS